jgi:hypothetical protein
LKALVTRFEDCELLEADIAGDGYCLPAPLLGPKHVIVVPRRGRGEERVRFTIAHELGHLACHFNGRETGDDAEERWCDVFASELLMPRGRVEAYARSAPSLHAWLEFPDRFKVSRFAAARQLWDYRRVILASERLDLHISEEYRRKRDALLTAARTVQDFGDTGIILSDGTPGVVRKTRGQSLLAVTQACRHGQGTDNLAPEPSGDIIDAPLAARRHRH